MVRINDVDGPEVGSNIVDMAEIARRAGTTPGTVRSWRTRHPDFPPPITDLAIGPIWLWPAVEVWLKSREGVRPGRPKKAVA
jgi:hypothetical protein